jgi:hypothetical protein
VTALGQTEIPGDHRIDAGYRIAQNNAIAVIAGAIERKVEFIFQNAEEGTSVDATQVRFIGAEASRLVTSAIRPGKHYWEKVATSLDNGRRVTHYLIFATVEMPEEDFKRSIVDALRRHEGKGGISAHFAEKVDKQWERFTADPQPVLTEPQVAPVETPAGEAKAIPAAPTAGGT